MQLSDGPMPSLGEDSSAAPRLAGWAALVHSLKLEVRLDIRVRRQNSMLRQSAGGGAWNDLRQAVLARRNRRRSSDVRSSPSRTSIC